VLKLSTLISATAATAISLLASSTSASGVVLNGSFETGDFTDWTTTGDTSIQDSGFGVTPTNGNYQAALQTHAIMTGTSAAGLESFLGLSSGTLTNSGATEGSAIRQIIKANKGDVLSFDYNFLTDEVPGNSNFNDFAFFTLDNNLISLADTLSPDLFSPSFSSFAEETGYKSFSYTLTSAGNYTLGFGVVDVDNTGLGDTEVNSGLLVDNVRTTPVPEPMTILGSLAALGFMKKFSKKRNENQD
jgi:hypothetical protein